MAAIKDLCGEFLGHHTSVKSPPWNVILVIPSVILFTVLMAYVFAIVPALFTGFLFSAFFTTPHAAPPRRGFWVVLAAGTLGYFVTWTYWWLSFRESDFKDLDTAPRVIPIEFIGALASMICTSLMPSSWLRSEEPMRDLRRKIRQRRAGRIPPAAKAHPK